MRECLFLGLCQRELLYSPADAPLFSSQENYFLKFLENVTAVQLLKRRESEPYRSVISLGLRSYVLAMQSFGKKLNARALSCAVLFSVLGSLLDDRIDRGTTPERESALRLLHWERGCGGYFQGKITRCGNYAEELLTEISAYLQIIRFRQREAYNDLLRQLQQAAEAESQPIYPADSRQASHYVMHKSVHYTQLGFALAASGSLSRREACLCRMVGRVYRLIDDLCDMEEDAAGDQINYITARAQNQRELLHSLEQAFRELDKALAALKQGMSREFYTFLLYELRLWTLSNRYIFQRSLSQNH